MAGARTTGRLAVRAVASALIAITFNRNALLPLFQVFLELVALVA